MRDPPAAVHKTSNCNRVDNIVTMYKHLFPSYNPHSQATYHYRAKTTYRFEVIRLALDHRGKTVDCLHVPWGSNVRRNIRAQAQRTARGCLDLHSGAFHGAVGLVDLG
jgi:hypothetical protein